MNFFKEKKEKSLCLWLGLMDFSWAVTYFIHALHPPLNFMKVYIVNTSSYNSVD